MDQGRSNNTDEFRHQAAAPNRQNAFDVSILPEEWCNDLDCYDLVALCGNWKKVIPNVSCRVDAMRSFLTLSYLLPAVDRISSSVSLNVPLLRRAKEFVSEQFVHLWYTDDDESQVIDKDDNGEPLLIPLSYNKNMSNWMIKFKGDPAESTTASMSTPHSEAACDESYYDLPARSTSGQYTVTECSPVQVCISPAAQGGSPATPRCVERSVTALLANLSRLEAVADPSGIVTSLTAAFSCVLRVLRDPTQLPGLPMCATRFHPDELHTDSMYGGRKLRRRMLAGSRRTAPTALLTRKKQQHRMHRDELNSWSSSCVSVNTAEYDHSTSSGDESTGTISGDMGGNNNKAFRDCFTKHPEEEFISAPLYDGCRHYYEQQHPASSSALCSRLTSGHPARRRRSWSPSTDELNNTYGLAMRLALLKLDFIDDTTIQTTVRRAATTQQPKHTIHNRTQYGALSLMNNAAAYLSDEVMLPITAANCSPSQCVVSAVRGRRQGSAGRHTARRLHPVQLNLDPRPVPTTPHVPLQPEQHNDESSAAQHCGQPLARHMTAEGFINLRDLRTRASSTTKRPHSRANAQPPPQKKLDNWTDGRRATTRQSAMLLFELAVCGARRAYLEVSLRPIKQFAVVCSEILYCSVRRAVGLRPSLDSTAHAERDDSVPTATACITTSCSGAAHQC